MRTKICSLIDSKFYLKKFKYIGVPKGCDGTSKDKLNFNQYGLRLFNIESRAGYYKDMYLSKKNEPSGSLVKIILPQSGYAKN